MEAYEHIVSLIALTLGASWASGINLYATLAVLGLASSTGSIDLPPDLDILANPLVITAAGFMYAVEFVTDKIPGVDSTWDSLHTFIRIPAGALLAGGTMGDLGLGAEIAALIVGGGMAATSHVTKAGSRAVINTSPEPFSNWGASIGEDIAVFAGLWAALNEPWWFLGFLILFILFVAWLLPKIWSALKTIFGAIGRLFGGGAPEPVATTPRGSTNLSDDERFNKLERLKRLLDDGALSQDEYETEKRKLL